MSPVAVQDGIWTWFNDPRAISHQGKFLIGSISSAGIVQITELGGPTRPIADLGEIDDHNNPALLGLPDGRLAVFYSRHNDPLGTRYKVGIGPEQVIPAADGPVTYARPFMTDGYVSVFRRKLGQKKEHQICQSVDLRDWAIRPAFMAPGHRPYVQAHQSDGRIHFAVTAGHPNEVRTGIYSFFMEKDRFYRTDGAALPENFDVRQATEVCPPHGWVWQVRPGAILATRYPSDRTLSNRVFGFGDIEYWLYQWTGKDWAGTKIIGNQGSLYPAELYYAGGLCFGPGDTLYLSVRGQIVEWPSGRVVAEDGIRPYYADGKLLWVSGYYGDYTNYSTQISLHPVQA